VVPAAVTIAILLNPNFAPALANAREAENAARAVGREIVFFNAASESEIDTAFVGVAQLGSRALLVGSDPNPHRRSWAWFRAAEGTHLAPPFKCRFDLDQYQPPSPCPGRISTARPHPFPYFMFRSAS
jgi:hypothetical protein